MDDQTVASSNKVQQRLEQYRCARDRNEKQFQQSGLQRPQDEFQGLKLRTRQLNLNVASLTLPENRSENWIPSEKMFESTKEWTCYAKLLENGEPHPRWILNSKDLVKLCNRLLTCYEFALDVECHSDDTQLGFIALIQISTWDFGDFLIGAYELHDEIIEHLKPIFEDITTLKVLHGSQNDILWLQRDFGIFLAGIADTQDFVLKWKGVPQISYRDLCHKMYRQFDYLLSDQTISEWRLRPDFGLTREQEMYATNDVHLLLRMFDRMRYHMKREDLEASFQASHSKTLKVYQSPFNSLDEINYDVLTANLIVAMKKGYMKRKQGLNPFDLTKEQIQSIRGLVQWRYVFAKIIDTKEDSLLKPYQILKLVSLEWPTIWDLNDALGFLGRGPEPQKAVIRDLLNSTDKIEYLNCLQTVECHNCLKTGHGPAAFCPFPKNKNNEKLWFQRPENLAFKEQRSERYRKYLARKNK